MNYYCDFETTKKEDKTRVWLACKLDDDNNYEIYNNIKDFLYSFRKSSTLYFHNLKFDGSFILNFC